MTANSIFLRPLQNVEDILERAHPLTSVKLAADWRGPGAYPVFTVSPWMRIR
jgi:hypothetical protein